MGFLNVFATIHQPFRIIIIFQILMSHGPKQNLTKLIKTIVIGNVSVGKSSIILKYAGKKENHSQSTVGIDILLKKIQHKGQSFTLELWDTAGHERYRTIVYNYFSHAQAAVVVFDLSDQSTLDQARVWLQQIYLHCGDSIPKLLIGNKSDLYSQHELGQVLANYKQKINHLKTQFNCQFYPVSAFTSQNLQFAFTSLVEKTIKQMDFYGLVKTIKLNSSTIQDLCGQKKGRCC